MNPDKVEFYYPTGYRKIPISTCVGGRELDKQEVRPCPGHEEEFEKKHGISGLGLFFAIVVPILAAGGVGYWLYGKWKTGGFGLGQIRLGDGGLASAAGAGGGSTASGIGQTLLSIPVVIISGVVAVAKALPLLGMSLWRSLKGYTPVGSGSRGAGGLGGAAGPGGYGSRGGPYRSRDAFARGRGQDYAGVVQDEDELLGDGADEDAEEV